MKQTMLFLLLILTTLLKAQPYEPGVLLGKTDKQIKVIYNHFYNYHKTRGTDSTLVYYDWSKQTYATYLFRLIDRRKYCVKCSFRIDGESGRELISSHKNDWELISKDKWLYHTKVYAYPITVELQYTPTGWMEFNYYYKP